MKEVRVQGDGAAWIRKVEVEAWRWDPDHLEASSEAAIKGRGGVSVARRDGGTWIWRPYGRIDNGNDSRQVRSPPTHDQNERMKRSHGVKEGNLFEGVGLERTAHMPAYVMLHGGDGGFLLRSGVFPCIAVTG